LAIAIFTALAARAAWVSASASRQAIEQANKEAEESRKIAQQQTEALMLPAKANALASRIESYNHQIRPLERQLEDWQNLGRAPEPDAREKLAALRLQQTHLVYWLDRQTNALGVGLGFKCPGSPYNDRIKD
jgi:hypothetical protein